jgi:hypothetical protein
MNAPLRELRSKARPVQALGLPEVRQKLLEADLVLGFDTSKPEHFAVFFAKEVASDPVPEVLKMVGFSYDGRTEELELLAAAVFALKGRCDYEASAPERAATVNASSLDRVIARARAALDVEAAVALLATVGWRGGELIVPLLAGRNFVGRGSRRTQPVALEQAQWLITCGDGVAEVEDAASTNLSVLVPRAVVPVVELGEHLRGFTALFEVAGVVPLPHANVVAPTHRHRLETGDVLRGCYAAFVFAWRAG